MTLPCATPGRAEAPLVLYSCRLHNEGALAAALASPELESVFCTHAHALLEEAIRRRPDVVVFEIRAECVADVAVLQLLRRVAPEARLVLVTDGASLASERMLRSLRPVYVAVQPVDPEEILDAVNAALGRRQRLGA